ncbi:NAD(P)-dependent oxidoreductase [Phenylobacterium sp. J367]|uniref:NAD(P)-dependent oxidoreductase n=1 Tax=Phenylobacterium sp. J367 TaxID=2898435 RepID=UPI002150D0E5|nr:NAD(P)-binding domain-containing protein [Phenylobacterium sp. J367]MCR5879564.1 NAD(P)-binding domain-containing protein [Phenylobacterium sp. J367]
MSKVAIIGLGSIGAGVARALAQGKGGRLHELTGYDVRPQSLEELAGVLRAAATPAAASAGADVVLLAVVDDGQVREVLEGKDGVLSASPLPRAVVILSTVTLPTVLWAGDTCAARGVALVDCGVSGGPHALAHASITSMVGGDEAAFEIVRPVIDGFSDPTIHCGQLGNGMRAKLARNLIIYTDWMVAWEGARLARAAGVPLDKFVQCVTASDRWVRPHMGLVEEGVGLESGASRPSTAAVADKDLRAALALGAELAMDLPAAELALARFGAVAGVTQP